MKILKDGYRKFYRKYFKSGNTLYKDLVELGQSPKTLIIACSDSRVDPSIITRAHPGDIFVVRNVANLVPPYDSNHIGLHGVSASLEFAVRILEVNNIVILGHSGCAGIHTLLNPEKVKHTDFIGEWMNIAKPAKEQVLKKHRNKDFHELQHLCEEESILLSLDNLLTFPWVRSKVENKKLKLHGWYFSLEDGSLEEYNPVKSSFDRIPEKAA